MSTYDLGDMVPLGVTITDANGNPANAGAVTLTIYLPDGTTTSPLPANVGPGLYNVDYKPTQVGRYLLKWVATGANSSAYADEFTVRDFSRMGVVSLTDAKQHLNITSSKHDEELRQFIDVATDMAERYTGCVLGRRVVTESYDGGDYFIRLRTPRAMSVASVTETGQALTEQQWELDHTGQYLYRAANLGTSSAGYLSFVSGVQNIVVTYTAGYASPPPVARQATLELLRHLWETQRGAQAVGRGTAPDEFIPGIGYSLPRRCVELLEPLRLIPAV